MKTKAEWSKIIRFLREEQVEWEELKKKLERAVKQSPEGRISVRMCKGKYPQYYYSNGADQKEQYIRAEHEDRIRALFQKEYDKKFRIELERNQEVLEKFLKEIHPEAMEEVYSSFKNSQKKWVQPAVICDQDFVKEWMWTMQQKKEKRPLEYSFPEGIVTNKGEKVRSKSEKIIADKLASMNIPYLYEVPLNLKKSGIIYPDFAILDLPRRRTVFLEHFGKMEDPFYARKTIKKIQDYAEEGYWFGDRLLYTFESEEVPLHAGHLEKLLRRYLLDEEELVDDF